MRILLILRSYSKEISGGAELQTSLLAQGLIKYGNDVTYLATDTNTTSRSRVNDVEISTIPGKHLSGAERHRQDLENAIQENRPDICYIRSLNDFRWAIPYCKQN